MGRHVPCGTWPVLRANVRDCERSRPRAPLPKRLLTAAAPSPLPLCPQRTLSKHLKRDNVQIIYRDSDGKITELIAPVGVLYSSNDEENPNGVMTTLPEEIKHAPLVIMNLCVPGAVGTAVHTFVTVKKGAPTPSTAIVLRQRSFA